MSALETTPSLVTRLLLPAAIVLAVGVAAFAVLDRMASDQRAARRMALLSRSDDLTARALASGSALPCLDAAAGDAIETACEAAIFASPQSTAAAVAYIGARLSILADAKGAGELGARLAPSRRAIELDRFGIAAHVLSERDGCSAAQCPGFALVTDANMLKSNMKSRTFDQYVSRHATAWNALPTPQAPTAPAVTQATPQAAPGAQVAVTEPRPVSSKYDFPSAASIPPVSIMNSEPPLSKEAAAARAAALQAAAPGDKTPPLPQSDKAADKAADTPPEKTPVPPRRPQAANEPADIAPAR
ncbi:MAG: hypothetical protein WC670_09175 [Pseudolabrys sp.]|jgi:hypothetical protein